MGMGLRSSLQSIAVRIDYRARILWLDAQPAHDTKSWLGIECFIKYLPPLSRSVGPWWLLHNQLNNWRHSHAWKKVGVRQDVKQRERMWTTVHCTSAVPVCQCHGVALCVLCSDGTLNPHGVRFGSAEIYNISECITVSSMWFACDQNVIRMWSKCDLHVIKMWRLCYLL